MFINYFSIALNPSFIFRVKQTIHRLSKKMPVVITAIYNMGVFSAQCVWYASQYSILWTRWDSWKDKSG